MDILLNGAADVCRTARIGAPPPIAESRGIEVARYPANPAPFGIARQYPSRCLDQAWTLSSGCVWTALRVQRTPHAMQIAGAITHRGILIDERGRAALDRFFAAA